MALTVSITVTLIFPVAGSLIAFRTGQPFNVLTDSDNSLQGAGGDGEGFQRPNLVGDPFSGVSHSIVSGPNGKYAQWINSTAFTQPADGTFGNLPRNKFYGPGYGSVDLSVFKNTNVTERLTTQFRVEFFNLFNRANFSPPNVNPVDGSVGFGGGSGFGRITDTIGDYNGAPGIGPGEPFNVQLALKILF